MDNTPSTDGYLTSQVLIAMPGMSDPRFERTVIYVCAHSAEGAMGLVINRLFDSISFPELLQQVGIECTGQERDIRIHSGGPVESGRGFVLHSADFVREGTMLVDSEIGLTASVDILKAIAENAGPRRAIPCKRHQPHRRASPQISWVLLSATIAGRRAAATAFFG